MKLLAPSGPKPCHKHFVSEWARQNAAALLPRRDSLGRHLNLFCPLKSFWLTLVPRPKAEEKIKPIAYKNGCSLKTKSLFFSRPIPHENLFPGLFKFSWVKEARTARMYGGGGGGWWGWLEDSQGRHCFWMGPPHPTPSWNCFCDITPQAVIFNSWALYSMSPGFTMKMCCRQKFGMVCLKPRRSFLPQPPLFFFFLIDFESQSFSRFDPRKVISK